MGPIPDERQLVLDARSKLTAWTTRARREAFEELFGGEDPILTDDERQVLDAIDSKLERDGGDGVWGTDQYGIHTGGQGATPLGVVCVYHPQLTDDSVLRGIDEVDDETEARLNDALWQYSERVAILIEEQLDEFVSQARD